MTQFVISIGDMCQFQYKCCSGRGGLHDNYRKRHLGNLNLIISLQITLYPGTKWAVYLGHSGVVGRNIGHDEDKGVARMHNPNRLGPVLPSSTK